MRLSKFRFWMTVGTVLAATPAGAGGPVTPLPELIKRLPKAGPVLPAELRAYVEAESWKNSVLFPVSLREQLAKFHAEPELDAMTCNGANQRLFKGDLSLILSTAMSKEKFSLAIENSVRRGDVKFFLDHVDAEGKQERLILTVAMTELQSELEAKIRRASAQIQKVFAGATMAAVRPGMGSPNAVARKQAAERISRLNAERDLAKADLAFLKGLSSRASLEPLTWAPRVARLMKNACGAKMSGEMRARFAKYRQRSGESMHLLHPSTEKRFHRNFLEERKPSGGGKRSSSAS